MCVAVDKEQVVAGYVNRHEDGEEFTLNDIDKYIKTLWNAGCGPIRLNFEREEMERYLNNCNGICLRVLPNGYKIDKSLLSARMTKAEREAFNGSEELAKSFDLFCRLQVDLRTPSRLLDAMGYHFIHSCI